MIDLVWNFPLMPGQQEIWSRYLAAAFAESGTQPVESLRPSFRTVEPALRERAAAWLGFATSRVWLTGGGHHGTLNALMASGLAGTRVIVEGNTYPGFLDQCWMTKTSIVACPVDEEGLIPEALRELCDRKRRELEPIHGLFTMPTVQNPLGFVTPELRREQILEIAREFHLTIIEDDAYGFMEENAPPSYAVLAPERTSAPAGNFVEWNYDFAVYGYSAAVLGRVFFPGRDSVGPARRFRRLRCDVSVSTCRRYRVRSPRRPYWPPQHARPSDHFDGLVHDANRRAASL